MQLACKVVDCILLVTAFNELETRPCCTRSSPFKVGIPFLVSSMLNYGCVIVFVGVFAILSEATQIADSYQLKLAILRRRRAKALKITRPAAIGIRVFWQLGTIKSLL